MLIMVDDVQGEDLIALHFVAYSDTSKMQIQADKARIFVDQESSSLVVQARDSRVQIGDGANFFMPNWKSFPIPLGNVTKREGPGQNPSSLPLRDMADELQRQTIHLQDMQQNLAITAAFEMAGGNMMGLTSSGWNQKHYDLEKEIFRKFRLESEPWRRWANGFSCLCFVIVGAPLAIRMRKCDFWTIFAVCFIPILLAYYPLLMFGIAQAKSGNMPPYIVWLGNVVMILVGLYLVRNIENN
jgi:lipopolysaccharide export system permease protein